VRGPHLREVAGGKLQLLIHRGERRRRDPYRDDEAVRCMYEHDTGDRAVEPDLNKLIELDRHVAVIERRTGARQTFKRRPVAVGEIALAWELVR
jgi:hypothetical protein